MTGTTDAAHAAETEALHEVGTAVAHDVEGGLPQFDNSTYMNQAVWLTISLVLIYLILSRIALPRIGGVLEQRSQTIQRDLDRAADMRTKAQEAEEAYNLKLQNARAEAQGIVETTKAKAQEELDAAIAKADTEIGKQAEKSSKRIAEMQADAETSISEIAKEVSGYVVDAVSPASNDGALIGKTLTKLLKG